MRETKLQGLLVAHEIGAREVAAGSGIALSGIYDILGGKRSPTVATVDAILAFLSARLNRRVAYEEAFGANGTEAMVVGVGVGEARA